MVSGFWKIAQTTSPSRFQLDFVVNPSLISCCYTQPPRRLLHFTFTYSHFTFICRFMAKITISEKYFTETAVKIIMLSLI